MSCSTKDAAYEVHRDCFSDLPDYYSKGRIVMKTCCGLMEITEVMIFPFQIDSSEIEMIYREKRYDEKIKFNGGQCGVCIMVKDSQTLWYYGRLFSD